MITSAEMKLLRRGAKYVRKDYKTNEDILLELKTNPVVKKIQNYRNKLLQHVRRIYRDRQSATFNYEISTLWEINPTTTLKRRLGY